MTKKDYKLIAEAISMANDSKDSIIKILSNQLAEENPKFNSEKFIEACNSGKERSNQPG
jgi:hypothetical protein